MADFQTRVEDLVGSVGDTQLITNSLTDAASEIVNTLPQECLWVVSTNSGDITAVNYNVEKCIVLNVIRENGVDGKYENCKEVPPSYFRRVQDVNSMWYPSTSEPVYILKNGHVFVYPAPGVSPNAFQVEYITIPAIAYSDSLVAGFPDELEYLIVLGGAIKCRVRQLIDKRDSATSTMVLPVVPAAPNDPSIDNTAVDASAISALGSAPIYNIPVVSLNSVPVISDLALVSSPPAAPTDPSFDTGAISVAVAKPTYTQPSFVAPSLGTIPAMNLPVIPITPAGPSYSTPTIAAVTFGSFGTAPVYVPPITSPSFSTVDTFISTDEDVELATSKIQQINAQLNQYQSDIQNEIQVFNDANVAYQASIQKSMEGVRIDAQDAQQEANLKLQKEAQEYEATLRKYSGEVQSYQAQVNTEIQRWKSEEFDKRLQVFQAEYSSGLQEYSSNIQNELNDFNQTNVVYQNELQEKIQEAKNVQTKDSSEYSAKIQKYSNELQSYQSQLNAEVQQYQQNMAADLQVWKDERQTDLQKYAHDIQNNLNAFNDTLAEYKQDADHKIQQAQINLQINIKDADLDLQAKVQDYQQELGKYQQELSAYQMEVNSIVQKYTSESQVVFQEHQLMQQELVQLKDDYRTAHANYLARYGVKTGSEKARA